MHKILAAVYFVSLGAAGVTAVQAADAPLGTQRPKILQIFMEEVKPGRGPAHTKNEAGWPAALRKANNKGYYLAVSGVNEVWFLNPRDSFAAAEAQAKADEADAALSAEVDRLWTVDGEMLSKTGAMTGVLNDELSYRADWDTAKMRYYEVTVMRIQPGYRREFVALRKLVNAAHDKVKVDERWSVYEIATGAPDDTYVFFAPLASLAEWDKSEAMHGKDYQDALGEETRGRLRDFSRVAVKSSETKLFQFSPRMSYVSKEMADRSPEFWNPKPPAAPVKKDEKK